MQKEKERKEKNYLIFYRFPNNWNHVKLYLFENFINTKRKIIEKKKIKLIMKSNL